MWTRTSLSRARAFQLPLSRSHTHLSIPRNYLLLFASYNKAFRPTACAFSTSLRSGRNHEPKRNSSRPLIAALRPLTHHHEHIKASEWQGREDKPKDARSASKYKDQIESHPDQETATTKEGADATTSTSQVAAQYEERLQKVVKVREHWRRLPRSRSQETGEQIARDDFGRGSRTVIAKGARRDDEVREPEYCLTGSSTMYEKDDHGDGRWRKK